MGKIESRIPIVLASGSPRRQQLLQELGLKFEVVLRPVSEEISTPMPPREMAEFIALKKANAYADLAQDHIVITADTVVDLEGSSLGKPADRAEAIEMLEKLSGKVNEVITGVCIYGKEIKEVFSEVSQVQFGKLNPAEIAYYVDTFAPYDKAGAYGIQEWIGLMGIESIRGDFYNVMGLPVRRIYQKMQEMKVIHYSS